MNSISMYQFTGKTAPSRQQDGCIFLTKSASIYRILAVSAILLFSLLPAIRPADVYAASILSKSQVTISKINSRTEERDAVKYLTKSAKENASKIVWASKNKKVAVISKKGVITAKAPGSTVITATLNHKTEKIRLTVKRATLRIGIVDFSRGYVNAFGSFIKRCCKENVVFVPITSASFDVKHYDGLIVPGGGDVNPARYGEKNKGSYGINNALDSLQINTIKKFVKAGKPVMGICRGAEVLNVAFGGSLIQHMNGHRGVSLDVAIKGKTMFNRSSKTARKKYPHTHHQGMKKLGKGLFTTMKTGKVIDGFEHETKPVYGLLFHPEGHKNGGYMFRRFFCKCFDARYTAAKK